MHTMRTVFVWNFLDCSHIVIFSGRPALAFIGSISPVTGELPSQLEFVLKQFKLETVKYSQSPPALKQLKTLWRKSSQMNVHILKQK